MDKWVEIKSNEICDWVKDLISNDKFRLLSTITGYHQIDKIYIIYHFITKDGEVNLKICVPHDNPVVTSISSILPGALLYEREIQDILGVKFENITDSRRLILPEDWPQGVYPLRKDFINKKGVKNE